MDQDQNSVPPSSPSHLTPLPVKSFTVAPGDVVGGFIYIMDKPVGIEEGMIGISVDNASYQNFIKEQLASLETGTNENKRLIAKYNQIKNLEEYQKLTTEQEKINFLIHHKQHVKHRYPVTLSDLNKTFFNFGKLHEVKAFRAYYENVGMGGLLFSEYKNKIGVEKGMHFAAEIDKFIHAEKDAEQKVFMVKQDGKLSFGRTGPGVRRILKTEIGQKFQILANPFVVGATGGLSLLAFAGATYAWRGALLSRGTISTVNSDAIVETIATKIANIRGFDSQEIEKIKGDYGKGGPPKIGTVVTWSADCKDGTGRLAGGEKNKTNVMVCCDDENNHIKVDKNNKMIRPMPDPNNKDKLIYIRDGKKVPKSVYDKAMAVSEYRVAGLGESLTSFICMGDRDGIGEVGQNKVFKKIDPPQGKFTLQFFGIDFGKAYEKANPIINPKIGNLQDDFSFNNPENRKERFLNASMLYDNPLRDKMKGIYLMAALRNKLSEEQKQRIVAEYRASGDVAFADKLAGYPKSLEDKYKNELTGKRTWLENGDLFLLKKEENEYRSLADKSKNPDVTEEEQKHYLAYADRLGEIYKTAKQTDDKVLEIFAKRLALTPSQIDVLDNLEKLTAKKVHILSPDGKVILNHIRVDNKSRTAWQLEPSADGKTFVLSCDSKGSDILSRLKTIPEIAKEIGLSNTKKDPNDANKIIITLSKAQFENISKVLTEEKVAEVRGLKQYRTEAVKEAFDRELNGKLPEVVVTKKAAKTVKAEVDAAPKKVNFKDAPQLPQAKKGFLAAYKSASIAHKSARHEKEENVQHKKSKIKRDF